MDKKIIVTVAVAITVIGLLVVVILGSINKKNSQLPDAKTPILYYGISCPHCKDLEEKISASSIEQSLSIIRKEVYADKTNAQELEAVGKSCDLSSDELFVPFLYHKEKCYIGTDVIFDYLSEQSVKEATVSAQN